MSCFFSLISFLFYCCSNGIHLPARSLGSAGAVLSPSTGLSALCCEGLWARKSFWRLLERMKHSFLFLFVEHEACRREIAKYCSSPAGVGSTWFIYSSPTWTNLQLHFNKSAPTPWFLCEEWGKERKGNEGKLFCGVDYSSPSFSLSFLAVFLALERGFDLKEFGHLIKQALSPWV